MEKTIDLKKLEYGIDYYTLPPKTIVYIKKYSEILDKLMINDINGNCNLILNDNNKTQTHITSTINGFIFE